MASQKLVPHPKRVVCISVIPHPQVIILQSPYFYLLVLGIGFKIKIDYRTALMMIGFKIRIDYRTMLAIG